ncbi:SubName: Full=Uncharacterized protein {ECO:0000313/EMBL:CCA69672.1} [Serendipita indica DSM 11827]|nr:SubName: Full=Uncharacterized protein {ECO:0000313/EMBL:CCA69672.1} [Serendipita indica DSM 11827]
MVKLQLYIKAELENVTDLAPASDDFEWFFNASPIGPNTNRVKCNSCNEQHPKLVSLNRTVRLSSIISLPPPLHTLNEERPLTMGKGTMANFVWKCSNCKRESSAKFDTPTPSQPALRPYTSEQSGQFAPLITIECRGLEFVGFNPQGIWKCKGAESETVFDEVDLSEGEWVDYDEKASILDIHGFDTEEFAGIIARGCHLYRIQMGESVAA